MVEREIHIKNELGLHARAAAKLVEKASEFDSRIILRRGGEEVNCKSILSVLSLGVAKDTSIKIICEGGDEEEALSAITTLIDSKFGEN